MLHWAVAVIFATAASIVLCIIELFCYIITDSWQQKKLFNKVEQQANGPVASTGHFNLSYTGVIDKINYSLIM